MNAISIVQRPSMGHAFRVAMSDSKRRKECMERLGWDDSQLSRFMSGHQGLPLDKLDAAIEVLDMVVTSRRYQEFLAYGAQIGTACECARAGMGECGRK